MFGNPQVVIAFEAGAIAAILSAVLGYFVVLRGVSFAGHAVTDIGLTGGAGAILLGIGQIWGLLAFSIAAAVGVDLLGRRARERDVATGIILAVSLGFGALFLHFSTRFVNEPATLLFGSVFAVDPAVLQLVTIVGIAALAATAVMFRPLLFSSVAPDAAALAGVPIRAVGLAFLIVMAIAVSEAAQIVGVLLSTALLVGPAASAMLFVRRPLPTIAVAAALGVAQTWLGIALAYESYAWLPGGRGWPVSFFVAVLALGTYVAARIVAGRGERSAQRA